MGVIAIFDPVAFIARYPEFTPNLAATPPYVGVNATNGLAFFTEAGLYFRNDGGGPVNDIPTQLMILNMLVAHIAMLNLGTASQPASGLVGRVSSASQGSVSVSTELSGLPSNASFFTQTSYGLQFWQATAAFRTFQYRRGPARNFFPNVGPLGTGYNG